jgi:hypothetical protein
VLASATGAEFITAGNSVAVFSVIADGGEGGKGGLRSGYCKRLPVVSDEHAVSFQTHFCKCKSSIRSTLTFVYGDRGVGFAGDSVVASAAGATVAASSAGWLLASLDEGSRACPISCGS